MILPAYRRGDLKDYQWQRLQPLLPRQKPDIGRPRTAHRRVINGILWILRTGAPWRDMPEYYGPWQTYLRTLLPLAKTGNVANYLTETTTAS